MGSRRAAVAAVAAAAYEIADRPCRFGHSLSTEEVRRMADETKVGDQWCAAESGNNRTVNGSLAGLRRTGES